jgi:hypothetical protein
MKAEQDFQGVHYVFSRDHVLSADFRKFRELYDPIHLSAFDLRSMFGRMSIELEDTGEYGGIATDPEGRMLIRQLHGAWPWAGFFLDLNEPFGPLTTFGARPILAFALCNLDLEMIAWDGTGQCSVRLYGSQFRKFRVQCYRAIDALGARAEIPPEVLAGRKEAVVQQLLEPFLFHEPN